MSTFEAIKDLLYQPSRRSLRDWLIGTLNFAVIFVVFWGANSSEFSSGASPEARLPNI